MPVFGASGGRLVPRAAALVLVLAATVGCSYLGTSPMGAAPTFRSPLDAPSTSTTPGPSASGTLTTIAPDSNLAQKTQQAHELLDRWDALVGNAPADAVIFTSGLADGGGWNGDNADDLKMAFMTGRIEAAIDLSADIPPNGQIIWTNGSKQVVDLISAKDALTGLVADVYEPGSCPACTPLQVVGAKLVSTSAATSRGDVNVPVWQFELSSDQTPIDPITFVAIKDAITATPMDLGRLTDSGGGLEMAYGDSQSSALTVTFVGSPWRRDNPCGADYTADAVESNLAVAVIIEEHHSALPLPVQVPPVGCPAVGFVRTASVALSEPLGQRTVLDVASAMPVPLQNGEPPTYSPWP